MNPDTDQPKAIESKPEPDEIANEDNGKVSHSADENVGKQRLNKIRHSPVCVLYETSGTDVQL